MVGFVTWALVCVLLSQLNAGQAPPVSLRFEGNVVLPNEVYQRALVLPPGAKADLPTAQNVAEQLTRFLRERGYELAEVFVSVGPDGLTVHLEEGQLEKVVFRGRFTVRMVRFKLALNLPGQVFNRPQLEREVAERAQTLGIEPPTWMLVQTDAPDHEGAQLEPTPSLLVAGRPVIHARRRFELHFTFGARAWTTGLGVSLHLSWLNGLELGPNYQGQSLWLDDDRWRVGVTGGVGLRTDIPRSHLYAFPSRMQAEALWFSPRFDANDTTRLLVQLQGELLFRQRKDLRLENYSAARTEFALSLLTRQRWISGQLGAGLQFFRAWGFVPSDPQTTFLLTTEPWRLRLFGELKLELTFFDGGPRPDHQHALTLTTRVSGDLIRALDPPYFFETRLSWQLVLPFGWNEVWLRVKGVWLTGDVFFPFEDSMGQYLPATSGDLWLRTAASAHVAYRYSLVRDLLQVGAFVGGVLFEQQGKPRSGLGAGPSAHLLLANFFQIDLFLNFAVLSDGHFGAGGLVWLKKVF